MKNKVKLFEQQKVRTYWDEKEEKWYFSVVDVVGILTESLNPRNYWKVLKHRLSKEGNESVTNCNRQKEFFKMQLPEEKADVLLRMYALHSNIRLEKSSKWGKFFAAIQTK